MSGEEGEQVELALGQLDRLAVDGDLTGRPVDDEPVERQEVGSVVVGGALVSASKHGADASDELPGREGLDDVVVGATLEAEHPVLLQPSTGENDDRKVASLAHRSEHLEAVEVG